MIYHLLQMWGWRGPLTDFLSRLCSKEKAAVEICHNHSREPGQSQSKHGAGSAENACKFPQQFPSMSLYIIISATKQQAALTETQQIQMKKVKEPHVVLEGLVGIPQGTSGDAS